MYKDRIEEIKVRLDNLIEEAQKIKHLLDEYDDETEEETMSIRIN
jgi:predicted ATP-grasp superfamily ATP-dependent carboligase